MPEIKDELEVERLRNLVQGFTWSLVNVEYTDTDIIMTIKKPRVTLPEELGAGPG